MTRLFLRPKEAGKNEDGGWCYISTRAVPALPGRELHGSFMGEEELKQGFTYAGLSGRQASTGGRGQGNEVRQYMPERQTDRADRIHIGSFSEAVLTSDQADD